MIELKPCPFCGCDVYFDDAYSYFRDSVIYCPNCDIVFTLDNLDADDDQIVEAWNRRTNNGWESSRRRNEDDVGQSF